MNQNYVTAGGTTLIAASTLNRLVHTAANLLLDRGIRQERGGVPMREMPGPVLFELTQPAQNLCLLEARMLNPWVSLAEFPWLLAGRSDVAWLRPYLPRAGDFSDNGTHWRAGYGPRLRSGLDQLAQVIQLLLADPTSRRAVISLWDPELDNDPGSKDYPCTNWLHFQLVRGRLDLLVGMRSNDLIWGFSGVNVTNFTNLQLYVAGQLGVSVGSYRHLASNLHAYHRHMNMLEQIARAPSPDYVGVGLVNVQKDLSRASCNDAINTVMEWRVMRPENQPPPDLTHRISNWGEWLGRWVHFMILHSHLDARPWAEHEQWWQTQLYNLPLSWADAASRLLFRRGERKIVGTRSGEE